MPKYCLEFILNIQDASQDVIRDSLLDFGDGLDIIVLPQNSDTKGKNLQIHIYTEDPTIIFDTCAQFGRLKSVKIKEG